MSPTTKPATGPGTKAAPLREMPMQPALQVAVPATETAMVLLVIVLASATPLWFMKVSPADPEPELFPPFIEYQFVPSQNCMVL